MFESPAAFRKEFENRIIQKFGRSIKESHVTERYDVLGSMVRDEASVHWKQVKENVAKKKSKQVLYFSLEFLMGRMLTNNLHNLGIYDVAAQGLKDCGFNIDELISKESDAGLGNGGLGRLAACYMDSVASLGYPVHGISIRYEYGFFRQKIEEGRQIEVPDQWLALGNVWEIRKPKHTVDVQFFGRVEAYQDGEETRFRLTDAEHIRAVPYDMPMVGYRNHHTNTLRLWSAEASGENLPRNKDFSTYLTEVRQLCHGLYPDDSTEAGKMLRLKQQYFFVSAGLQAALKAHLRVYPNFDNLAEKLSIQLNDTHPVLAIPELMRLLMDEHHYGWDKAWNIVTHTMAFTNHTVMAEALEKWPVHYIQNLLPRVYTIIEEINRRHTIYVRSRFNNEEKVRSTAVIRDGMIYMANLAIVGSFSINGVAYLHTEILKNDVFKDFYKLWPEKFNNKTNGITHRRWFMYANPQLTQLVSDVIGEGWKKEPSKMKDLMKHVTDENVQQRFLAIKKERKQLLANFIKANNNIDLDVDSIFDIQVKRLHAYKRQMMNVLHIIYLYQRMKEDRSFRIHPHTFIFGAKAAPSYHFAKKVIELINSLATLINNDPDISPFMKVVFIENYDVSKAEIIMPAADISEQISTAGKEASGTGNMKFMMNGALTLGTLDGANVEISELVGSQHAVIFGLKEHEVVELRNSGSYNPWNYYHADIRIRRVMDALINGSLAQGNGDKFRAIYDEIMYRNDEFFLLADFASYVEAQETIVHKYLDRKGWAHSCLVNIAQSGFFSSDRSIKEYAEDIWHVTDVAQR